MQSETQEGEEAGMIDFLAIAALLWTRRYWIATGALLFAVIGLIVAFTERPSYNSEALITPNEQQASAGQALLGNLGSLGGMVAGLGMGNNSLFHLELLMSSRDMAEIVVKRRGLLETLLKAGDSKRAPSRDTVADLKEAVAYLHDECTSVEIDQTKKTLHISIDAPDANLAADLVRHYLVTLREKIQEDARAEADSNRSYLQFQMERTTDPLLREKILHLMSMELEKAMLVGSQPYQVIESPQVPDKPEKPKKKLIVLLFALSGLSISIISVLLYKIVWTNARV